MTDESWDIITTVPRKRDGFPLRFQIGRGYPNKDGSFTIVFHSLPLNGELLMRKRLPIEEVKPNEPNNV